MLTVYYLFLYCVMCVCSCVFSDGPRRLIEINDDGDDDDDDADE